MTKDQAAMMLQLQQLGLTMDDLGIYLDTHLTDSFAIERFNMTAQEYHNQMVAYCEKYGPLVPHCGNGEDTENWKWAMQDFPWDY